MAADRHWGFEDSLAIVYLLCDLRLATLPLWASILPLLNGIDNGMDSIKLGSSTWSFKQQCPGEGEKKERRKGMEDLKLGKGIPLTNHGI